MKLSSISGITYPVSDIQKTAEFYEALGFRTGKQDATHLTCYVNWFWVNFVAAGQQQNPNADMSLHLKVENADEFYQGVIAKGMKPDGEPKGKASTGREFSLRDPDGYKLVFFEKK
jgi:catechol 2,3-dioxygenase-like lactoylglutathione lyase family enzyme